MRSYTVTTEKVGLMKANCYIIKSRESDNAVVVDPGGDEMHIKSVLRDMDAKCVLILLTHGHFDHILGVGGLRSTGCKVAIHSADAHYLTERDCFSSMIPYDPRPFEPADFVYESDGIYHAGEFEFSVIHTPGHTPGSVCFAFEDCLFTGDTLFKNAIGRTDFSDGSPDDMRASLAKLYRMPGDFVVYPGHDERSLLSDERDRNPFFADVRGRVWEK